MRVLIAGCGYVGSLLGEGLATSGHEVFGLRREAGGLPPGIRPLEADLLNLDSLGAIPEGLDFAVYTAAPGLRSTLSEDQLRDAYRAVYLDGFDNLLRVMAELAEKPRVIFASSTSVYGQRRGEWVDETSSTDPARFTGDMMLLAEGLLRGSPFAGTSVRFGGIYGPGRTRLVDRVRSGEARFRPGGPHYTNRIHRDDAAGALQHLIETGASEDLYLAVDNEPADERSVAEWLAEQLGAAMPQPVVGGESARDVSSKRCRNTRLLSTGYQLRFPSFRDGYSALLEDFRSERG